MKHVWRGSSGHRPGSILEMMKLQSPGLRVLSDPKLTAILKEWGFTHWGVGGEVGWVAPSLIAMRKQWVANVRPETWDDDGEADWQDPAAEASFPDPEDYAQGGTGSGNWQVGQDERDLYETLQRKAD